MTVITAAAILLEQCNQLANITNQINIISNQINNIANQENPSADINSRIKGLCAAMNVQNDAEKSQCVLVQQALDVLAELVNG